MRLVAHPPKLSTCNACGVHAKTVLASTLGAYKPPPPTLRSPATLKMVFTFLISHFSFRLAYFTSDLRVQVIANIYLNIYMLNKYERIACIILSHLGTLRAHRIRRPRAQSCTRSDKTRLATHAHINTQTHNHTGSGFLGYEVGGTCAHVVVARAFSM